MEKDARFWYKHVDCEECKMKVRAVEIFYNDEGKDVVAFLCRRCAHLYGQREMTCAERQQKWIN